MSIRSITLAITFYLLFGSRLFAQNHRVFVETDFGADQVAPTATGSPHNVEDGDSVTFQAPAAVYLAEDFSELEDTEENIKIARYKAIPKGYSIESETSNETILLGNSDTSATIPIMSETRFTWDWELQVALVIDPSLLGTGAQPPERQRFYPRNTIVPLSIAGEVDSVDTRSLLSGYTTENITIASPIAGDTYARMSGEYDPDAGDNDFFTDVFGPGRSFTIEYWLRKDTEAPSFFLNIPNTLADPEYLTIDLGQDLNGAYGVTLEDSGGPQVKLSAPRALLDNTWHHWAFTYTARAGATPAKYRLYRDEKLVAEKSVSAANDPIETAWSGGWGDNGFTVSPSSYNNMRVWRKALTVEHLKFVRRRDRLFDVSGLQYPPGLAEANMRIEWMLDTTGTSPGANIGPDFPASFLTDFDPVFRGDRTVSLDFDETGVPSTYDGLQIVLDDWKKVTWHWEGQVLYTFDAMFTDPNPQQLNSQPFLRVYDPQDPGAPPEIISGGSGPNIEHWVPLGSDAAPQRVDVGCVYRTADRCYTLDGIIGTPTGNIPDSLTIETMVDTTVDLGNGPSVARMYSVANVTNPSDIHWQFTPTVYRAELALGQGVAINELTSTLVPALCVGGSLQSGEDGPSTNGSVMHSVKRTSGANLGEPVRWDQLGQVLYPVHPGVFLVEWPDENNPAIKHKIEIVTDFPNEPVDFAKLGDDLPAPRQNSDGSRQTTLDPSPRPYYDGDGAHVLSPGGQPLYFVTGTTLAGTTEDYPAHPAAHYRHTAESDADRRPPTFLDADPADQWHFVEMTSSESATKATVDNSDQRARFSTSAAGRSVLLFRHRPNPDEIANGSPTKELLSVRVVQSELISPTRERDLVLGERGLQLGSGGISPITDNGGPMAVSTSADTTQFSIDLWINTKDVSPEDAPIPILDFGGQPVTLTLDPQVGMLRANYFGIETTAPVRIGYGGWQHCLVHISNRNDLLLQKTFVKVFVDGRPYETGGTRVGAALDADSLVLGSAGQSELLIDEFRIIPLGDGSPLTPKQVGELRTGDLSNFAPLLWFDFELTQDDKFLNLGARSNIGLGTVTPTDPRWRHINLEEVAQRLHSSLDRSGFGSGYILNELSNYNPDIYDRGADVGEWGGIYPVNHGQNFTEDDPLQVAYYENPARLFPNSNAFLHPNVDWPYAAVEFEGVTFPDKGDHRDKAIYISSRVGSEGVDRNGFSQQAYDLANFANLQIYNQPDAASAGYNPNEEHALLANSNRAALNTKAPGENLLNNPALAAFALQNDINVSAGAEYTSEPWVLVQFDNLETGETEMAAYQVFETRDGNIDFPPPVETVVDPEVAVNFSYQFNYPAFAGDLLIPPYPLNLVIGNVTMLDERGANIQLDDGTNQRTLWRDVNHRAWVVSGGGRFFHQYFYPMRGDFFLADTNVGAPVPWLPEDEKFDGDGSTLEPVKVRYHTSWRSDYPKLKRGETLTYQGGEFFNETPGSNGLPAVVAMAAAELIYDSKTPSMILGDSAQSNRHEFESTTARIVRPLDRHEASFSVDDMQTANFTPASTADILIVAERWYFKELPGSLQRRFYFDSLAEKLVFRGYLNDKDSGDPELTAGPDPINVLEPNVLTQDEYEAIFGLASSADWQNAINHIYRSTQNPYGIQAGGENLATPVFLSGLIPTPGDYTSELTEYWDPSLSGTTTSPFPASVHLDSFGVGSALIPNPNLLTESIEGALYVTIAENNRTELDGAPVSLHIIEVIPDRYRGAIKAIEGADAFSEKITLQHNGEFGANTDELYYEWWIRDAAPLDVVAGEINSDGTLKEVGDGGETLWQEFIPLNRATLDTDDKKHMGLHSIVFEGRPDVTLADKLVLMRYRHIDEDGWTLVPFQTPDPVTAWQPGTPDAPFQWAGAANSPQLQADGSKRYVPQLIMGWVKRVLDRINPYEARYTDFFGNESPATYSSQIQIAGAPFAGAVALNPDKNVIENVGLIELYETVLQRARQLSIDNSTNAVGTEAINQALLLASTRLAVLYELLGREAYADAQDPTITVGEDDGLGSVAAFTHAFQNLESDVLHEELALLRGTDFRKSYPVFNRMFWNYTKGLGEAAYNVNYNIYDENTDGFINEDDARSLFPQGHGDAWGHYLSALDMHYELLQHPVFSWKSRPELYALMSNVIEADFLDEKTFAKVAAAKARAGRDTVRATYRQRFTDNPDGQWQGYSDSADPARAWGVSEWSHRAGQGAYFDWLTANAILPEEAANATPVEDPENLDNIERLGAETEIGEIAAALHEVQVAMDEANTGANPLGFDSDAIAFDLNQEFFENASGGDRRSHFEQIYTRALVAGGNALSTLEIATQANQKLRRIADDTDGLLVEAFQQDLDYRNRLIEIFGRPYDGTIGFGEVYPEGYQGPDTLLFAYLDKTTIDQVVPPGSPEDTPDGTVTFSNVYGDGIGLTNNGGLAEVYKDLFGDSGTTTHRARAIETFLGTDKTYLYQGELPVSRTGDYAFQSGDSWGQRESYGRLQTTLEEMLIAEIELDAARINYVGFLQDWEAKVNRLESEITYIAKREDLGDLITRSRSLKNGAFVVTRSIIQSLDLIGDITNRSLKSIEETLPRVVGFSNDVTSAARGALGAASIAASQPTAIAANLTDIADMVASFVVEELNASRERDITRTEELSAIEGLVEELVNLSGSDQPLRDDIGLALRNLELKRQEFFTAQAEGFRLLREREAFNKVLAASVQKNRYQDMLFRLSRNETMAKYQSAYNQAARYTWMAAKAYDYETSLDAGDPAAASSAFDQIIKTRQLGLWADGEPQVGQGGLAEILAQLSGNFAVLKGQLGIDNPQQETGKISLRHELFRIADGASSSDERWASALKARIVDDLTTLPEFRRHCRPFSTPEEGAQPGIVIRFSSEINNGVNFFGNSLMPGDHAYSTANFATKIRGIGVWLENYNSAALATTPRAYLVPIGNDYLRTSSAPQPTTRLWSITEQRIPTPFVVNQNQLSAPGYIPSLDGVEGGFGQLRRHGDFRMYHDDGEDAIDEGEIVMDTRLVSRSVWNSEWMLIIPGTHLDVDPMEGLMQFSDNISDIRLHFLTYSHQGQ